MSARTLMHFDDGTTLTDNDLWPHDLSDDKVEHLTSVERVIQGRHLTILKSPIISNFFVLSDAYEDWSMTSETAGGGSVTARTVGCHLKGSDPLTRIKFSMDPRTMNVHLLAEWIKPDSATGRFDMRGFAASLNTPPKLRRYVNFDLDDSHWSIVNEPPVRRVWGTGSGLACLLSVNEGVKAVAEIRLIGTSCQLLIVPES